MSSDGDRLTEIEARLKALRVDTTTLRQQVAEIELHLRRQDEKLDMILAKLFEPERLRLAMLEQAGEIKRASPPEDIDNLLSRFLRSKPV